MNYYEVWTVFCCIHEISRTIVRGQDKEVWTLSESQYLFLFDAKAYLQETIVWTPYCQTSKWSSLTFFSVLPSHCLYFSDIHAFLMYLQFLTFEMNVLNFSCFTKGLRPNFCLPLKVKVNCFWLNSTCYCCCLS